MKNARWWNFSSRRYQEKYEIKKQVIGGDADLEKSGKILNRVIEWGRDGITIEADQEHVREILKDLGLERANHSATPCAVERKSGSNARSDDSEEENRCGQGQTQTKHEWDGMGDGDGRILVCPCAVERCSKTRFDTEGFCTPTFVSAFFLDC